MFLLSGVGFGTFIFPDFLVYLLTRGIIWYLPISLKRYSGIELINLQRAVHWVLSVCQTTSYGRYKRSSRGRTARNASSPKSFSGMNVRCWSNKVCCTGCINTQRRSETCLSSSNHFQESIENTLIGLQQYVKVQHTGGSSQYTEPFLFRSLQQTALMIRHSVHTSTFSNLPRSQQELLSKPINLGIYAL